MFEIPQDGPSYYVRFELHSDYLNLLYVPHSDFGPDQVNQSLRHLFRAFSDSYGTVSYFDPQEYCIVTLRSKDLHGLRIYLYDDAAPYDGLYLDGRFVEALEGIDGDESRSYQEW